MRVVYTITLSTICVFCAVLFSCSTVKEEKKQRQETVAPNTFVSPVTELTPVQQAAFDALNTLQTSTDEMNRLYSTFANADQPFYPADTSFSITQSELLTFMKQFVSKYCQDLSEDVKEELVRASVLAQEEYTVLYCNDESLTQDFKNGLPTSGAWVIPNVLGRRDVIIIW
ncbi:MAG: hypothetical protein MRY83_20095 [Flavobacteriales bacterium]|nr:hypothetical protein [Flavobacteriales bacterium]